MEQIPKYQPQQAVQYQGQEDWVCTYIEGYNETEKGYQLHGVEGIISEEELSLFDYHHAPMNQKETFETLPLEVQVTTALINEHKHYLGSLLMEGKLALLSTEDYEVLSEEHQELIFTIRQLYIALQPLTQKENIDYLKSFYLVKNDVPKFNTAKAMKELPKLMMGRSQAKEILASLNLEPLTKLNGQKLLALVQKYGIDISQTISQLQA